jgi:hypothetical protein
MYKYRITQGGNSWEYEYTETGLADAETKCDELEIGYENIQTIHIVFSVENDPLNSASSLVSKVFGAREAELKSQFSVIEQEV